MSWGGGVSHVSFLSYQTGSSHLLVFASDVLTAFSSVSEVRRESLPPLPPPPQLREGAGLRERRRDSVTLEIIAVLDRKVRYVCGEPPVISELLCWLSIGSWPGRRR